MMNKENETMIMMISSGDLSLRRDELFSENFELCTSHEKFLRTVIKNATTRREA